MDSICSMVTISCMCLKDDTALFSLFAFAFAGGVGVGGGGV